MNIPSQSSQVTQYSMVRGVRVEWSCDDGWSTSLTRKHSVTRPIVRRLTCPLLCSVFFFVVELRAEIEPETQTGQLLEQVQENVSDSLFELTDQIDEYFDDVRTEEQRQDDWVRIGAGLRLSSEGKFELSQRVRASFNLSPFSNRLKLVVGGSNTDSDSETEQEANERGSDDQLRDEGAFGRRIGGSGLLGLRYDLYRAEDIRVVASGGYRFRGGLQAFSELRGSIRRRLNRHWAVEPTQFLFWIEDDGFGERTRLDFTRTLFKSAYLRLRSEALWSETSDGLDLIQEYALFREIGRESYISLVVFAEFDAHPSWQTEVLRFSTRVKTLLFEDWLFGELEPFLEFPDSNDHDPTPGIAIRFDAKFSRPES